MAKRTLKDIAKDLTPKEIEAAHAVFANDTLTPGKRKSYEALADSLEIGTRTLYEWRHKDAFIEYTSALTDKFAAQARAKVMRSVVESAEQGNAAMAKLFLQTQAMLTDKTEVAVEGTAVDKAEVARKLAELKDRF